MTSVVMVFVALEIACVIRMGKDAPMAFLVIKHVRYLLPWVAMNVRGHLVELGKMRKSLPFKTKMRSK